MLQLSRNTPEQTRLIQELQNLDRRLSFNSNKPLQQIPICPSTQEYASFNNSNQIRTCNPLYPNNPHNIQYFSEIGNHEEDEDSLFAHGSHFLKENRANVRVGVHRQDESKWNQLKKQQVYLNDGLDDDTKKSIKQSKQTKILQILKEQDYIYRKQKSDLPNPKSKKQTVANAQIASTKPQMLKNKSSCSKSSKFISPSGNLPPRSSKNVVLPCDNAEHNLRSYLNIQDQSQVSSNKNYNQRHIQKDNQSKNQDSGHSLQLLENYYKRVVTSQQDKTKKCGIKADTKIKKCAQGKTDNFDSNRNSLQCTFKPKILKKSQQMIKSSKNVVERLATSGHQKATKKPYQPINKSNSKPCLQRIDELSRPRKLKTLCADDEQEVPSFRPSLSKKSLQHMSNCTYNVATRNKLWLQQKEQKLSRLRRQEEEERHRKQDCTHSPMLKPYRGQQQAQFSKFGKQGMVQYFQRLSMMKKRPSAISFKREESSMISRDYTEQFLRNNKENMLKNINQDKLGVNLARSKKQTYEEAVKQLHNKILKLKI